MRESMTSEEVDSYREHGFLAIPDLLDADELEHWRTVVDDAVAQRSHTVEWRPLPDELADDPGVRYYQKVFTQRVNLWQTHDGIRSLLLDERLGRLATQLAGVDGVRLGHDQALIKEPWANPTAFHLDIPYWSYTSTDAISIWVALDNATLQNGCLLYVPGSHLARKFDNVGIGPELGALFTVYPEFAEREPVACPVPAGGCTFHNGLTAHGAGANMTPFRRRAMTAGFMPDGSTFNGRPNIMKPEQLERLSVGDVLDDPAEYPLVFACEKV